MLSYATLSHAAVRGTRSKRKGAVAFCRKYHTKETRELVRPSDILRTVILIYFLQNLARKNKYCGEEEFYVDIRQTGKVGESEETTDRREQNKARFPCALSKLRAIAHQEVDQDEPDLAPPKLTGMKLQDGEDEQPGATLEVPYPKCIPYCWATNQIASPRNVWLGKPF